jgi:cytochrome c oxidase subunit 3
MSDATIPVAEPFSDGVQQHRAARLGMWVFLATELLLFGGIFVQVAFQSLLHHAAVSAATHHLEWYLGAINSAVLLTSSLCMSVGVEAARGDRNRLTRAALLATALLGCLFLGIKCYEYFGDYRDHLMPFLASQRDAYPDPLGRLWLNLYYAATGLHALHLSGGIVMLLVVRVFAGRLGWLRQRWLTVEIIGLYWQFVDFIWMLLFPLLYLINR